MRALPQERRRGICAQAAIRVLAQLVGHQTAAPLPAAAILIVRLFRTIERDYIREAIVTGIVWLFANWVLDLIVLVGMLGMTLPDYATQIGLRYLVIPVMVIVAGVVAEEAAKRKNL